MQVTGHTGMRVMGMRVMDQLHCRTERAAYLREAAELVRQALAQGTVVISESGGIVFQDASLQELWYELHHNADAVVRRYYSRTH